MSTTPNTPDLQFKRSMINLPPAYDPFSHFYIHVFDQVEGVFIRGVDRAPYYTGSAIKNKRLLHVSSVYSPTGFVQLIFVIKDAYRVNGDRPFSPPVHLEFLSNAGCISLELTTSMVRPVFTKDIYDLLEKPSSQAWDILSNWNANVYTALLPTTFKRT